MKLLQLIALTLFMLSVNTTVAQETTVKDSLYTATYNELKVLYLKRLDSEIYQEHMRLLRNFYHKTNLKSDKRSLLKPDPIVWIEENLAQTDFFSVFEAQQEWDAFKMAEEKEFEENKEYHRKLRIAIFKVGPEILRDLMMDAIVNYPDRFNPPPPLEKADN
ncbi:hypothetical protein KJK34_01560 [Flavobacterium sp. D11R37]|uniref:hypothetical protein n=1 Tax=Flavobacterium coralii TaxID=2838017 RepID=UPI001CA6F6CC|nr:hypothetical protein [Flavobacterium coralii]MBY8961429.1 hypothetical protein [Flavobacterium coralii]